MGLCERGTEETSSGEQYLSLPLGKGPDLKKQRLFKDERGILKALIETRRSAQRAE